MGIFYAFLFQPLIKGKYIPILWFITLYCLEMAPKIHNNSKFSRGQEMFANVAVVQIRIQNGLYFIVY